LLALPSVGLWFLMTESLDTPNVLRVRSVVEEVEVGRDFPPVLMLYSVTILPTFPVHPSSEDGQWTRQKL
jgi:hypothetical protein